MTCRVWELQGSAWISSITEDAAKTTPRACATYIRDEESVPTSAESWKEAKERLHYITGELTEAEEPIAMVLGQNTKQTGKRHMLMLTYVPMQP